MLNDPFDIADNDVRMKLEVNDREVLLNVKEDGEVPNALTTVDVLS